MKERRLQIDVRVHTNTSLTILKLSTEKQIFSVERTSVQMKKTEQTSNDLHG